MDLFQRGFQERLERRNRETRHAPISTGRVYGLLIEWYIIVPVTLWWRQQSYRKQTNFFTTITLDSLESTFPRTTALQGRAFRLRSRQLSETRIYISLQTVSSFLSIVHMCMHLHPCRLRFVSKTSSLFDVCNVLVRPSKLIPPSLLEWKMVRNSRTYPIFVI